MKNIVIDTHSMDNYIVSLKEELERLKTRARAVLGIPEIADMDPKVYLDRDDYNWRVVFAFEKCYAYFADNCRATFVHYDDGFMNGRKEETVTYYEDDQLVAEFRKHVEFLK